MEQIKEMSDPRSVIEEMRGQAMVMGFNDSETQAFDSIIEELDAKTISVQEAFKRAQAIINNKQDYH